jgi:hypothetical protein
MKAIKKLAVKRLAKPIRTVINIRVKCWRDKMYGNSYYSYRVVINNDYGNELVGSFRYGSYEQQDVLKEVLNKFAISVAPYKLYSGEVVHDFVHQDASILVIENISETTKSRCKLFGVP